MQPDPTVAGPVTVPKSRSSLASTDPYADRRGVWVGDVKITPPYSNDPTKIGLYRPSGEGGDFDLAELNAVLRKFYEEHF